MTIVKENPRWSFGALITLILLALGLARFGLNLGVSLKSDDNSLKERNDYKHYNATENVPQQEEISAQDLGNTIGNFIDQRTGPKIKSQINDALSKHTEEEKAKEQKSQADKTGSKGKEGWKGDSFEEELNQDETSSGKLGS